MTFNFSKENDMEAMAKFVSQLVREGVTFTVETFDSYHAVTLTGGY